MFSKYFGFLEAGDVLAHLVEFYQPPLAVQHDNHGIGIVDDGIGKISFGL